MRTFVILTLIFFSLISIESYAQKYSLYSNDKLIIQSEYLQEEIVLNLHLPETFLFSAQSTKYPITIIFDSQHERTYPQIVSSFDLLTSETQIPESIIIGIPFDIQNRYHLTSINKKEGDFLSGIERMELFLFKELIPKLQKENKANDFITIIGHSRTAFLVNYLTFKRTSEIAIAISLSGFFSEPPLSIQLFSAFILNPDNFPRKLSYYATSGSTMEESTYLTQYQKIFSTISDSSLPQNLKIQFKENKFANHMTNYWLSVPEILTEAFADYNFILDNWFYKRLKDERMEASVDVFQNDLKLAGDKIGFELLPSVTHIFSLASHFGYQKNDYETALSFLDLGLKYYPDYLDFFIEIIEFNKLLENNEKVKQFRIILRDKTVNNKLISEAKRKEILEYLEEK